jgi:hypothetical protein
MYARNVDLRQEDLIRLRVRIDRIRSAYQVDDTCWAGLVTCVLGKVQKTLSSVGRPGSVVVGNLWLLATEVADQALVVDWLILEPEVLALETSQFPIEHSLASMLIKTFHYHRSSDVTTHEMLRGGTYLRKPPGAL